MLTPSQQQWIDSLRDGTITIVPYDERTERLFLQAKARVHNAIGDKVVVEHCGASSLGISGQDEIDVSILANKDTFDEYIPKLEKEFGPVRSRYPDRARFEVREEGKKIDLKIVDVDNENYKDSKIFENYLKNNPEELERYKALKEECNGKTTKEYYTRKTEFINEILEKAI